MAKTKKISVNAFEKVLDEMGAPTVNFDWHGIEVTVKKTLSFKEMLEFVDGVVKSCFTETENTYLPEIKDFAIKVNILEKYANFAMPRSVESRYDLVYRTDAVDAVMGYVNGVQFEEMCNAIDDKLYNLAQANIEAVHRQMNELYNAFDNLQDKLSGIFGSINPDDIQNIASAMANGVIDEEKLVKAYVDNTITKSGEE